MRVCSDRLRAVVGFTSLIRASRRSWRRTIDALHCLRNTRPSRPPRRGPAHAEDRSRAWADDGFAARSAEPPGWRAEDGRGRPAFVGDDSEAPRRSRASSPARETVARPARRRGRQTKRPGLAVVLLFGEGIARRASEGAAGAPLPARRRARPSAEAQHRSRASARRRSLCTMWLRKGERERPGPRVVTRHYVLQRLVFGSRLRGYAVSSWRRFYGDTVAPRVLFCRVDERRLRDADVAGAHCSAVRGRRRHEPALSADADAHLQ